MERTQGIVIRTTDYKEKDRILTIFTPRGLVTVTARGVRAVTSKLRTGTSVMTFGEFSFGGRNVQVLTGADISDNFFTAWTDMDKMSSALFCFELTEKCFDKEEETVEEFIFLLKILNEIAYGQSAPICSALKYLLFCSERLGVDYTVIQGYDDTAHNLITAFAKADIDDTGTLSYSVESIKHAILLVNNVLKDALNVKLITAKSLLK